MSFLDALVLGFVQGVAEFLPISSSGHLIIARELLGIQVASGLAVDATLQLATVLAVIVYFRRDLMALMLSAFNILRRQPVAAEERALMGALVLGTIPAVGAGLLLEETMDTVFRSAHLVAWVLIAGSLLLLAAEYARRRYVEERACTWGRGFAIGCFQALALIPGMSRSGATIAGGMLLGFSRERAARFSFLLAVPIILGSGLKKLLELGQSGTSATEWHMILVASVVAFGCGIAAIHFLLRFLRTHSLVPFVVYRIALAALVLIAL